MIPEVDDCRVPNSTNQMMGLDEVLRSSKQNRSKLSCYLLKVCTAACMCMYAYMHVHVRNRYGVDCQRHLLMLHAYLNRCIYARACAPKHRCKRGAEADFLDVWNMKLRLRLGVQPSDSNPNSDLDSAVHIEPNGH